MSDKNIFEKTFFRILKEEITPEEISDADAMKATLDPGTNPSDFDAQSPTIKARNAAADAEKHMVGELNSWIAKLTEFSNFLNSTDPGSIQSKLKDSVPDTLFDKIKISENKKIARVAMEVVSLNEMLKGYAASANNPGYRFV